LAAPDKKAEFLSCSGIWPSIEFDLICKIISPSYIPAVNLKELTFLFVDSKEEY